MKLVISLAGRSATPAHPPLSSTGLAVSARRVAPDAACVLVSFRAPIATAHAYERLHEALAVLVEVPALGVCASELLIDGEVHRDPAGTNWLGSPASDGGFPSWVGGAATARVVVQGLRDRVTVFVRAALRDMVSPPSSVELGPDPAPADLPAASASPDEEG